jgi:GWxTD domain-containing protein
MCCKRFMRHLAITFVILAFAAPAVLAQKDQNSQDDPQSRQRNVKSEVKRVYKDWPNTDVGLIITDIERKAYNKLQTDEEREQFIEQFWARRNPDPDSDTNSYREEYYERIAYANEHYASGVPGWKTDRGRIYIKYGKPDEIESHPAGGQYERPYYEGGGSTSTYPFETWFYRNIPGVSSGVEIEFVDPSGSGEYHIARNPDEKDAMLYVPGAGRTLSEQLGGSTKADRIAGIGSPGMTNYRREQDSPFSRQALLIGLDRPPQVRFRDLETILARIGGPVVEDNPLNFNLEVHFFRQSDMRVIAAFTVQTENNQLSFTDSGGVQTARINIYGRITALSNKRLGVFEDTVTTTATPAELVSAKDRTSAYQREVVLPPGRYKVDVLVRDVTSGATGIVHKGFELPEFPSNKLSTSSLVLASRLQDVSKEPAVGSFVIGQTKVIPNLAGIYHRGEPLGIYLQIYNAGIDQTTLRPSVEVEYVLMKDGKELGKQAEDWRGMGDSGQRLTLARLIATSSLSPGQYDIAIRIHDRVSGQTLAPSARFTIVR